MGPLLSSYMVTVMCFPGYRFPTHIASYLSIGMRVCFPTCTYFIIISTGKKTEGLLSLISTKISNYIIIHTILSNYLADIAT